MVKIMPLQWDRLTISQIDEHTYYVIFEGKDGRGEGELTIEEDADWPAVARHLQYEHNCEVIVKFPEGSDPQFVVFQKDK